MSVGKLIADAGIRGAAYACPIAGGEGVGYRPDEPVSPASVMKIQIGLVVLDAIASGTLDGSALRVMSPERRTPGPVGMSLMRDGVSMSVRDLVIAMMTISDNVATDELIDVVGVDAINDLTNRLGLTQTRIEGGLAAMLDQMAREVGFVSYDALAAHDPERAGPPTAEQLMTQLAASSGFDPSRGTRTTARETISLLQAIWTDRAAAPQACARLRQVMGQQLTKQRIASGFPSSVTVAAKSGALMGIVRNEAGVVTFPNGNAYAVAVFTRRDPGVIVEPKAIDALIGDIARDMVDQLHES